MAMKRLRVFTSNRLEVLVQKLAWVLADQRLKSPLDREIIVVQSKGMERWVSMELARYHGICANAEFPFPKKFVTERFQKVIEKLPELSPFDPKVMAWRIMKLLPVLIRKPGFGNLRLYLEGTDINFRCFQLAMRLANIYDRYLIFRPERIFKWEKGEEDHWQAMLWRALDTGEGSHPATLRRHFFKALETELRYQTPHLQFPERVSIFGISDLPKFHMEVFDAISWFTQVNLFLMNPCQEYWSDILSNREIKRATARQPPHPSSLNPQPGTSGRSGGLNPQSSFFTSSHLHLEQGNSLLASMGTLGRDFFELIHEFGAEDEPDFEDPGEESLLHSLQSDILHLRERGNESGGKAIISKDDRSVQIHSCHSPMREIEVLHDRLLELFETDPTLSPSDILVMAPTIEDYSPYIQAVFDLPKDDPRRIPFSIADRSIRTESRLVDTFMQILDFTNSRFGAAQVVSILEYPPVCRRFDLSEAELERIRRWIRDTRIRWGINADIRAEMGLPGLPENTWDAGLDRLLLGYALPGGDQMFEDILPYDFIEGTEAATLGKFVEFERRLFSCVQSLEHSRALSEWSDTLMKMLSELFMPDEDIEIEAQNIRSRLNELHQMQTTADFHEKIGINIIKNFLNDYFKEPSRFGFITGGVTFCAMLPMRSIPFKVIGLVGMNSDAYPRQSRPLGFDLMAKHPKRGDPSGRNDDRYLFLESLLSAREKLYISHMGQSIKDNSLIQPSVLVSELMDTIEKGFEIPGQESLTDHLVTKHRLQAFSLEYFRGRGARGEGRRTRGKGRRTRGKGRGARGKGRGARQGGEERGVRNTHSPSPIAHSPSPPRRLFSYSEENLEAARSLLQRRERPPRFISGKLSEPPAELRQIDLSELCRFFGNPAKFLLNQRLGIYFDEKGAALEERESFDVQGLDKYVLVEELVKRRLEGWDIQALFTLKKAAGQLPHGTVGECVYEKLIQEVDRFVERISPYIQENPLDHLEMDMNLNGFKLIGKVEAIYPKGLLRYRCTKVKSKDRLNIWIHHLALNCRNGSGPHPRFSRVAGSDAMWEYQPVENSQDILESLLETYWEGLKRPLPFFPEASCKYAETRGRNRSHEDALRSAQNVWTGSEWHPGELDRDFYFQQCFGHTFDPEFQSIALNVFKPLLEHQRKVRP